MPLSERKCFEIFLAFSRLLAQICNPVLHIARPEFKATV
jgi:hypothetical protein